METYCLYSHDSNFDAILQRIKQSFPQSNPQFTETEGFKVAIFQKKGGLFSKGETLKLSYRQKQEPTCHLRDGTCPVSNQMKGMYNFISSLPSHNKQINEILLRKIETINSEIIFQPEPRLTPTTSRLLQDLAQSLHAFLFITPGQSLSRSNVQHFTDQDFNLLLDAAGNTGNGKLKIEIESHYLDKYGASPRQLARKERTEQLLRKKGIVVNPHLPVTEDATEVVLRDKNEIIQRVYALAVMAARGEGVPVEQLEEKKAELAIDSFTEEEKRLYVKKELTQQEKAALTWRYESLNILMWALRFVDQLTYPADICNVPHIVDTVIHQERWQFEAAATLRDKEAVLEQMDLIYRMHWACVDARLHKSPAPPGIHPSIIYERHYALNWLARYQDQDWDDVTTDT